MANINEKIYIGSVDTPTLSFDQRNIEDIVCNNAVNLIGDELSSDTLEVSVFFDDANEVLRNTAYGTPVFYYSNDYLVGKYYVAEIERKGLKRYLIRSTSLVGLIEKEDYYGGFYNGEHFSDVMNDILLTNGLNLTKYYLYKPISGNWSTGVRVRFEAATIEYYKYRIYLDFEIVGYSSITFDNIAGGGMYFVDLKTSDGNSYETRLFYNDIFYPVLTLNSPKIGSGSRIIVDINPLAGTAYMSANYVNPDDNTDTGFIEVSTQITIPTQGVSAGNISRAYGTSSQSGYPFQLIWYEDKVWDETGTLIIDPMFAVNSDGTKKYVINRPNWYVTETTYFSPYGDQLGMFGNFDRIDRDVELTKNLVYGSNVENINVYGWIDSGTRRDALHQLLFANNVAMLKDDIGGLLFTILSKNVVGDIGDDYIYDDSKEKSMNVAKTINITEYTYEESDSSQVLYDNSNSTLIEGQYIAMFDKAPIYGTPVGDGITILYSNCNAAIITGRGKITGTPYNCSKNVITYSNIDVSDGSDVSVRNIGLITSRNSDYIMSKLKAYYSGSLRKILNSIKYSGEKCGLKYLFKTLYSDTNNAFLTKINALSSSFIKAKCEFISGYVPPTGSGYTDYAIRTYNERWDVPDSVHSKEYPTIRLNIIGKGHDGTAGTDGVAGSNSQAGAGTFKPGGAGGAGGTGGVGGAGGYIYSVTVDATNAAYIIVVENQYQTVVRIYNSSDVMINAYSSASGNPSENGFLNVFDGFYYARKGLDGYDGAAGGTGGSAGRKNTVTDVINPTPGEDVDSYTGGKSFSVEVYTYWIYGQGTRYYYNSYGGGGGAAYGTNGNDSTRDSQDDQIVYTTGGAGANAIIPPNPYTEYGSGGFGGHGGGGGGGAGTRFEWLDIGAGVTDSGFTYSQTPGAAGLGSSGTPGIDGCVIIYY